MTETVFDRVLRDFKCHLTQDETDRFKDTTISDLQTTIMTIQKEQASSRASQKLDRIRGFLEAAESYANVLDVFVNVNEFVAFIWGPVKYLLLVARTVTEAFDALLGTYERISEYMPQLIQYQTLSRNDKHMSEALSMVFANIFRFHLRALRYFETNRWKQFFQAHAFNTRFRDIIDDLARHKQLIEAQVILTSF